MRYLLYSVLLLSGLTIVWLLSARSLSLLLDHLHTALVETPKLDHFRFEGGVLELGPVRLYPLSPEVERLCEVIPVGGRVELRCSGQSFPLGPGDVDFVPDPGDQVELTVERSALSWPTPFEFNFMTGVSPSWRRSVYYRLKWAKRNGATLEMLWRTEQAYRAGVWSPLEHVITIGLIRVRIR